MENDDLPPDELLADLDLPIGDDLDADGRPNDDAPIVPPIAPPLDPADADDLFELPELPDVPDRPAPDDGFPVPDLDEAADLDPGAAPAPAAELYAPAPVDLDLDGQLEGEAPGPGGAPAPDEIDLSLDPDADLDGDPTDGADADGDADPVDLPLADDQAFFEVAAGNAWVTGGLIAAGLVAIGASVPALARLGRATPPDLAAHLDELGIDARVEHLDVTGLEELLRDQRTVLLSTDGSAGVEVETVLELHAIDRIANRLTVVDGAGARSEVLLARFEAAWADSANQIVLATGTSTGVALVPVVLGRTDLQPVR
ncbi:MAG: hypothetical protein ABIP36_01190 [Acidimicrobiales bacterium]